MGGSEPWTDNVYVLLVVDELAEGLDESEEAELAVEPVVEEDPEPSWLVLVWFSELDPPSVFFSPVFSSVFPSAPALDGSFNLSE